MGKIGSMTNAEVLATGFVPVTGSVVQIATVWRDASVRMAKLKSRVGAGLRRSIARRVINILIREWLS